MKLDLRDCCTNRHPLGDGEVYFQGHRPSLPPTAPSLRAGQGMGNESG